MILLFNVKITSQGLSHYHRSPWLPKYDRLDIFKYCLASYSALLPLLSKVILHIQIEQEFAHRQQELEDWINELYPSDKLELNWYRNNLTQDWRNLCEKQKFADDDLIWFAGNDDHIFIDSSLDVVSAGIKLLNEDPDPLSVIYYSHWPEQMRMCMHYSGQLTEDKNYIKFIWRTFDAIRIIKGARFKRYWAETDFGNQLVYRTDHLYHAGYELTGPVYAPTKELVRHYDGYSHVSDQLINILPPLVIPPGFFEKNIKLRVGYSDRDDKLVNLYPPAQWLHAANSTGTDYRWVETDIPLFWKDRISSINKAPDYDQQQMNQARDAAFIASTRVPMYCYQIRFSHEGAAPPEWFNNHTIYGKN